MLTFGINQEELTGCKHYPKYIRGSKDHGHLPRHFKAASVMRKHWFQSLTSTQPESAWEEPAAPNARKASVSEIESSFFIKGRC